MPELNVDDEDERVLETILEREGRKSKGNASARRL